MQPVNLLTIGDLHICDHAPGKRRDTYKNDIIAKLEECITIAKENNATHVLFLGDIFHLKAANRVSHRLVQEIANILIRFEVPVIILVGNHDITDGNLDTLVKQPLGVLRIAQNVTLLGKDIFSLDEDIDVYPVPGTTGITIDDYAIQGKNKRDIMVVHQSIVPDIEKENQMLKDILFDAKSVAEKTNIDIVLYGHQHRTDGMYKVTRDNGTTAVFSNLGSICRLTINDDDVYKVPAVLMLSFADNEDRTITPTVFKLESVRDPNEVYKLEDHLEEKEHSRDIEEAIKKLKDSAISVFSIDSVISDVEKRKDIEQPVREAALKLLEEVR